MVLPLIIAGGIAAVSTLGAGAIAAHETGDATEKAGNASIKIGIAVVAAFIAYRIYVKGRSG